MKVVLILALSFLASNAFAQNDRAELMEQVQAIAEMSLVNAGNIKRLDEIAIVHSSAIEDLNAQVAKLEAMLLGRKSETVYRMQEVTHTKANEVLVYGRGRNMQATLDGVQMQKMATNRRRPVLDFFSRGGRAGRATPLCLSGGT